MMSWVDEQVLDSGFISQVTPVEIIVSWILISRLVIFISLFRIFFGEFSGLSPPGLYSASPCSTSTAGKPPPACPGRRGESGGSCTGSLGWLSPAGRWCTLRHCEGCDEEIRVPLKKFLWASYFSLNKPEEQTQWPHVTQVHPEHAAQLFQRQHLLLLLPPSAMRLSVALQAGGGAHRVVHELFGQLPG